MRALTTDMGYDFRWGDAAPKSIALQAHDHDNFVAVCAEHFMRSQDLVLAVGHSYERHLRRQLQVKRETHL